MTNKISLYFHIPFCVKKCDYCAFYSIPNAIDSLKQEYFEALLRQIEFFPNDKTVRTIYFGGGTPPLIGIDRIVSILDLIKKRFILETDCEITIEVNPKTVDFNDLVKLRQAGVNRLSVGIQSSNDEVLKSIGRIHNFFDARECVRFARLAGFENISGDLMFALPNSDRESIKKSLTQIIDLGVNHISAYSLQLEENTPLFAKANELLFPDEESEESQYNVICDILKENGFKHYEVSSFCKEGFESRHNSAYWQRFEYFGFGASAHSFYNGVRFSSPPDVKSFIEKSYLSLFAPTDFMSSEKLSSDEALEEEIMLGLRTSNGALIPSDAHNTAKRIQNLGFGTFDGERLILNSKGFRVSNTIIGEIINSIN